MKAAILEDGKLEIRDTPKPEPRQDEALVRITSAGCATPISTWSKETGRDLFRRGQRGVFVSVGMPAISEGKLGVGGYPGRAIPTDMTK